PVGRKEVLKTVKKLREKKKVTVILITHYMEEVISADRVFVMESGQVVMTGTPREIFARVDELKSYRMDVPQVTMLAHELKEAGVPISGTILSVEELVEEICQLKSKV
ncbi:MAG: energy-coupling factor transporter ATPase, partial [Lachnospiraceae bacterium]|nr:energy-coupling factor transporter ATPase [Lachnospiraceae bacterium]